MRVANTTMPQQRGHSPARVEYAASGCHRGHNGSAEVTRGQASRHMASGVIDHTWWRQATHMRRQVIGK